MRARAATLLLACVALTGCTTTAQGNPEPDSHRTSVTSTPPTSPPPSDEQDRYGAPRVANPLNPDSFVANPCTALTDAQLAEFGLSGPGTSRTEGPVADQAGTGCSWGGKPGEHTAISLSFMTGNENGLADVYRVRERDAYFEETTVNGYPAVFRALSDRRDRGTCSISVGVTDNLYFFVREVAGQTAERACSRAKQVAAAVVTTMKGA